MRKGENLYVKGSFTSGTVAGSLATLTLPNNLTIDTTKTSITNTSGNPGPMVGNYEESTATANTRGVMVTATGTSTSLVYFGISESNASSAITPGNGNAVTSTGAVVTVDFVVPISGWAENQRAPTLIGSVTSNSVGALRIESAFVTSTGVVTEVGGSDWINGNCTNASTAVCTFNSGTFSSTPVCSVTSANSGFGTAAGTTTTSTTASVQFNSGAKIDFALICMGPR